MIQLKSGDIVSSFNDAYVLGTFTKNVIQYDNSDLQKLSSLSLFSNNTINFGNDTISGSGFNANQAQTLIGDVESFDVLLKPGQIYSTTGDSFLKNLPEIALTIETQKFRMLCL